MKIIMKNIFKSILTLGLLFSLGSCEDEQDLLFLEPEASFQILSPTDGDGVTLNPETPNNPSLSLTWEDADYGTPTEVTYIVQVDKSGDDFDTPIDVVSTTNTYTTITSETLNKACKDAGLAPFTESALDVRIKGTVGTTGAQPTYSTKIAYLVTPYSTDLPLLSVPGNHQGWNPVTAPRLAASAYGKTDFEGYAWLDGDYKFASQNPTTGVINWPNDGGGPDYGDDGTFSGVMVETGESNCNNSAGYYLLKADTEKGTYSATLANWAITGAATPNGWPDPALDHDMTYNPTTKKWEITIALSAGEFKFRANNGWSINLGGDSDGDGSMDYGGPNLTVATAGTYTVILDLSNPRKYTYSIQ